VLPPTGLRARVPRARMNVQASENATVTARVPQFGEKTATRPAPATAKSPAANETMSGEAWRLRSSASKPTKDIAYMVAARR